MYATTSLQVSLQSHLHPIEDPRWRKWRIQTDGYLDQTQQGSETWERGYATSITTSVGILHSTAEHVLQLVYLSKATQFHYMKQTAVYIDIGTGSIIILLPVFSFKPHVPN